MSYSIRKSKKEKREKCELWACASSPCRSRSQAESERGGRIVVLRDRLEESKMFDTRRMALWPETAWDFGSKCGRVARLGARLVPMGTVTIRVCDNAIVGTSEKTPVAALCGPVGGVQAASTRDPEDDSFRTMPATFGLVHSAALRLREQHAGKGPAGVHGYGNIGALHCTSYELIELVRGRTSDAPGADG